VRERTLAFQTDFSFPLRNPSHTRERDTPFLPRGGLWVGGWKFFLFSQNFGGVSFFLRLFGCGAGPGGGVGWLGWPSFLFLQRGGGHRAWGPFSGVSGLGGGCGGVGGLLGWVTPEVVVAHPPYPPPPPPPKKLIFPGQRARS